MQEAYEQKIAGILTPLFAIRGRGDLGVGNLAALREFIDWAAKNGFRLIQLLPVNETGADHSPYNAISSVALDPSSIDLRHSSVLGLSEETIQKAYAESGLGSGEAKNEPVDWDRVRNLVLGLLKTSYHSYFMQHHGTGSDVERQFARYRAEEKDWIETYALFRLLVDENGGVEQWDLWPQHHQTPARAREWVARQPDETRLSLELSLEFVIYIQWLAFTQWREIKAYAELRGVRLMGDIPFGVNYYSADVWANPELFDLQWSGGAPPEPAYQGDTFVRRWGQNWGVPLYNWDAHRAERFAWWRQRVAKQRAFFHFYRLDHVLGFFRMYAFPWRPQRNGEFELLDESEAAARTGGRLPRFFPTNDETVESKMGNRLHGEDLLRAITEDAGGMVGEDLGTVPDYVRPSLLSLGIPGFKVPYWEDRPDGTLIPGGEYPRLSVSTYATHDHEPLRVLWDRWMATIEAALVEPERLGQERDRAWWEVRRLAAWAGFEVPRITPFSEVHERLLEGLFRANSWAAVVMITDLFQGSQRFNLPGSVGSGNWTERLAGCISDWQTDPSRAAILARLPGLISATGRAAGAENR